MRATRSIFKQFFSVFRTARALSEHLSKITCARRSDKKPPDMAPSDPATSGTHEMNHASFALDMPTSCQGEPVRRLQDPSMHQGKAALQICVRISVNILIRLFFLLGRSSVYVSLFVSADFKEFKGYVENISAADFNWSARFVFHHFKHVIEWEP